MGQLFFLIIRISWIYVNCTSGQRAKVVERTCPILLSPVKSMLLKDSLLKIICYFMIKKGVFILMCHMCFMIKYNKIK